MTSPLARLPHVPQRSPWRRLAVGAILACLALALLGGIRVHAATAASSACGATPVPAGETNVSNWSALTSAVGTATPSSAVAVALTGSIPSSESLGDRLAIPTGASVTIDLLGCDLEIDSPPASEAAIEVPSTSTFTIEDSSVGPGASAGAGGTLTAAAGAPVDEQSGTGAGIGGDGGIDGASGESSGAVSLLSGTVDVSGGDDIDAGALGGTGAGIGGGGGGGTTVGSPGTSVSGALAAPVTLAGAVLTASPGSTAGAVGAGAGAGLGDGGAGVQGSAGSDPGGQVEASQNASSLSAELGVPLTVDAGASLSVPAGGTVSLDAASTNAGTIVLDGTAGSIATLAGTGSLDNSAGTVDVSGNSFWAIPGNGSGSGGLLISGNSYDLSLNEGSGTGAPSDLYVFAPTVADSGQSLPSPTPPGGATFTGWFATSGSDGQVTDATDLSGVAGTGGPPAVVALDARYVTPQTITFAPLTTPAAAGSAAALSATGGASGQPVTFSVDGATSPSDACAVSQSASGAWRVAYGHAGTCVIDANQAAGGDNGAAPAVSQSVTVQALATTASLASPIPVVFGQSQLVRASVSEPDGSTASGSVQFAVDGSQLGGPVTVSDGSVASPDLISAGRLAPGSHAVTATFTPTDATVQAAATATTTVVVNQAAATTLLSVGATRVSASVSALGPGTGTPTGSVSFSVGGKPLGTVQLADGMAVLDEKVPAGESQEVEATYSGDADFTGSSATTSPDDPRIVAHVSSARPKTKAGWYRTAVRITFSCTTDDAPLTNPCPSAVRLSRSKASQSVTRTILTTDGGAATVVVKGIDIDRVSPRVKVIGVQPGAIYAESTPKLACSATDALSGIASYRLSERTTSTSRQGLEISTIHYTALATDRAGNTATTGGSYRELGIYLQQATYSDGAFVARAGKTYTIVVRDSSTRPMYLEAAADPLVPSGRGDAFTSLGHGRWAYGVYLTPGLFTHVAEWKLGVKIGAVLHSLVITSH